MSYERFKAFWKDKIMGGANNTYGTTFKAIQLDHSKYDNNDRLSFLQTLKSDLVAHRDERLAYYDKRRAENYSNTLRTWMAVLALVATVTSALAAGLRVSTALTVDKAAPFLGIPPDKYDLIFFAIALSAFALLGGLAVYEKSLDLTASYFRHNTITLAIRDLWTRMEFEFFREFMKEGQGRIDDADFDRIMQLANAFCNDINKLTSDEHGEFKAEFLASMSELDAIAKKGVTSTTADLDKAVKAHQASADKARQEAEKARAEAEAAAKKAEAAAKEARDAAEASSKPGYLNVTVKGDFDGSVSVKLNGQEHDPSAGRNFSVGDLKQGVARLELSAKKGQLRLTYDQYINVTGGLQQLEATLT